MRPLFLLVFFMGTFILPLKAEESSAFFWRRPVIGTAMGTVCALSMWKTGALLSSAETLKFLKKNKKTAPFFKRIQAWHKNNRDLAWVKRLKKGTLPLLTLGAFIGGFWIGQRLFFASPKNKSDPTAPERKIKEDQIKEIRALLKEGRKESFPGSLFSAQGFSKAAENCWGKLTPFEYEQFFCLAAQEGNLEAQRWLDDLYSIRSSVTRKPVDFFLYRLGGEEVIKLQEFYAPFLTEKEREFLTILATQKGSEKALKTLKP